MSAPLQQYERWEPIGRLPEAPLSGVDCRYEGGLLFVEAQYAQTGDAKQLYIEFDYVEAFKVYEEFSDPWMETGQALPQVRGENKHYRYPLQEVLHSDWVARVMKRNGAIDQEWRHFVVVTMDVTLHVMTAGPPKEVELRKR